MLIILGILLPCLILLFSGDQGSKSIISTVLNAIGLLIAIFLMYKGINPILVTALSCIYICAVTIFYQNEVNVKSKISFISVLLVLCIMVPVIYYTADISSIQGFTKEQYEITDSNGYSRDIDINMIYVQICVMIIALIGTVIDIAVAVASSMYEIYNNNPDIKKNQLFIAGMNVGKDVLSTSIHTIFYIYIAEYLTLMLQFTESYSFAKMINSKAFCQEFITIAISGIGCCLILPIVTLVGVALLTRTGLLLRQ